MEHMETITSYSQVLILLPPLVSPKPEAWQTIGIRWNDVKRCESMWNDVKPEATKEIITSIITGGSQMFTKLQQSK